MQDDISQVTSPPLTLAQEQFREESDRLGTEMEEQGAVYSTRYESSPQ